MANSYCAEALVIGAGPAGLGTALGLARSGIDVVVLEQQKHLGLERRGETIRFDREMDELLGQGFFKRQAISRISRRTYYSHSGNRDVSRTISNPNNIINWTDFIMAMADMAEAAGAKIWTDSMVMDLNRNHENMWNVSAAIQGSVEKDLRIKAVFSCGGCDDPGSRHAEYDRTGMDMPIFKQLVKGYTGPMDRLEYYFHVEGKGLIIGTIFPRTGNEAEVILLNTMAGSDTSLSMEFFLQEHPRFSGRLEGTKPFYMLRTRIPMGGMLWPVSPEPGLVMAGDALGHVQARGGSGIKTSFLIGYTAGVMGASAIRSGQWSSRVSEKLNREMRKSAHMRSLKRHNLIYSTLRKNIFARIRTPEDMDRYWPYLKIVLR